jgi:hypothetical protein
MEFLLGKELVEFFTCRSIFHDIFDTDKNLLVDKLEVMSVVCLVSRQSNLEKIHFFFDLFNFNNKGYLLESEIKLMLLAVSRGCYKADQKYVPSPMKVIDELTAECLRCARVDKTYVRKPELVQFVLMNKDVLAFLDSWRGHASQVLLAESSYIHTPL